MGLTVRQRAWVGIGVLILLAGVAGVWVFDSPTSPADGVGAVQTNSIGLPVGEIVVAVLAVVFWAGVAFYLVRRSRRRASRRS